MTPRKHSVQLPAGCVRRAGQTVSDLAQARRSRQPERKYLVPIATIIALSVRPKGQITSIRPFSSRISWQKAHSNSKKAWFLEFLNTLSRQEEPVTADYIILRCYSQPLARAIVAMRFFLYINCMKKHKLQLTADIIATKIKGPILLCISTAALALLSGGCATAGSGSVNTSFYKSPRDPQFNTARDR